MSHSNIEKLLNQRKEIMESILVGSYYYHYRNSAILYKVIAVGFQEATEELCVIYQNAQNPDFVWVRNYDDWNTIIEVDGKLTPRFIRK